MILICKLCGFRGSQRSLFGHYRLKHAISGNKFPFKYFHKDCHYSFKTIRNLSQHLFLRHNKDTTDVCKNLKCKLCKHICRNRKKFFLHLQLHLKKSQLVQCPVAKCSFSSSNANSFRSHLNRFHHCYHSAPLKSDIDDTFKNYNSNKTGNVSVLPESEEILCDSIIPEDFEVSNCNVNDSFDIIDLKKHIASFLVKIQAVHQIPVSTVQEILNGLNEIHILSKPIISKTVKTITSKYNLDSTVCDEIQQNLFEHYPLYFLTQKNYFNCKQCLPKSDNKGSLSTHKLRKKFVRENLPYVEPVEFNLGYRDGKNRTFVYVSIVSLLRIILLKNDILSHVVDNELRVGDTYKDYKDGNIYKQNAEMQNEARLLIGLYQDDFETVNPLGTSKKLHKLSPFYWVLVNLPPKYRSKLHMIQRVGMK